MAGQFCTSANLVTTITNANPGPFALSTISGGTITVNSGTGPAGNNQVTFSTGAGNIAYVQTPGLIASTLGCTIGLACQWSAFPSATTEFCSFQGTSTSMTVQIGAAGAIILKDAGGTNHISLTNITTGTRHYIEVQVSQFAASGNVIINVDGAQLSSYTGINTNCGYPVAVRTGTTLGPASSTNTFVADSWYVLDTGLGPSGNSPNTTFLGPRVVTSAISAGVGQFSQWTPNGAATIWQCLNSIPPPGDTTYASDATPPDKFAVAVSAINTLGSVNFIQVEASMRQESSGRTVALGVGNGTSFTVGQTQALSTAYSNFNQVFDVNPNNNNNSWTVANLTGLQVGAQTMS